MLPQWGIERAITLAEPMEKSSSRVSTVISSPRNSSMRIGKTGGCTAVVQRIFQAPLRLGGAVHRQPGPGILQRAEERQSENVVEVEMGQEGRGMQRGPDGPHLLEQHIAQGTQSRAEVDDEGLVPFNLDHQA